MKQPWSKAGTEPRIWDVLADPIVLALMKADRVSRSDVLRASTIAIEWPEGAEERIRVIA